MLQGPIGGLKFKVWTQNSLSGPRNEEKTVFFADFFQVPITQGCTSVFDLSMFWMGGQHGQKYQSC